MTVPGSVAGHTPSQLAALAWSDRSACRDADPDLFYPPDDEGRDNTARLSREAAAKAICGRCRVRTDCLLTALAGKEPFGVWGGLTERERTAALTRAGRAAENGGLPAEARKLGVPHSALVLVLGAYGIGVTAPDGQPASGMNGGSASGRSRR